MIAAWLLSLLLLGVAVVAYRRMNRTSTAARLLIAGAIWLTLPVALSLWVFAVGDAAPVGAVTIVPPTASPK
jgi:hypothetical protein